MAISKYRAPNPVIHQRPGLSLIISNFNFKDYLTWAIVGGSGVPLGYVVGTPHRIAYMWFGATIGFTAGFFLALQNSTGRLLGFTYNKDDVARHPYRLDFIDYEVRTEPYRVITEEEHTEIKEHPRF